MNRAPTVADALIRESLRPHGNVPSQFGRDIAGARRFVLDDGASRFMADLAHASHTNQAEDSIKALERTRQLSRLPHQTTWIEYNARAFRERTLEAYGNSVVFTESDGSTKRGSQTSLDQVIPGIGWLLKSYNDTVFTVDTCFSWDEGAAVLPFVYGWSTEDTIPPWPDETSSSGTRAAALGTGVSEYKSTSVTVFRAPWCKLTDKSVAMMRLEFSGELRFVWALLASINDISIGVKNVTPAKGFIARGKYRKFVEHTVISVLIPKGRDPQKVARQVVELSRHRAHIVRGHWRRDWRHESNRIWIKEHQRGDASLGFVLHDYKVEHLTGEAS